MKSLFSLTGIFQPPLEDGGYTAVPMLSDASSSTLFVFVMFPGAYADIYEIASKSKFANIFIVPVSLNAQYITDVHRLVTDLTPLKSCVKVLYPGRYPIPVNSINELAIIRGDTTKCTYTFNNGFIAFDKSFACNCICDACATNASGSSHDILVRYDNTTYLLTSTKVNADRILRAIESRVVDYVYVPYSYGYVNQDNFLTLIKDERLATYHDNIIAYGFRNYDEFKQCYLKHPMSTPMTYRSAFIEDGFGTLGNNFAPAIGSIQFCPSIFYIGGEDTNYPQYKNGEVVATEDEPNYLPQNQDDPTFIIEDNPDPTLYELKKIELQPGTNYITRMARDIPFVIYFTANRHIKYVNPLTADETHDPIDVALSWEDLDVGMYNADMELISLKNLIENYVLGSGDREIITFFNNHRVLNEEASTSELVYETDTVTIYYYDIAPIEEPKNPEEGSEVNPDAPEDTNPDTPTDGDKETGGDSTEDASTPSESGNGEDSSTDTPVTDDASSEVTTDESATENTDTTENTTNESSPVVDGPDGIDVI